MAKGQKKVSADTDVSYANANRDLNIFGDLQTFDVNGWGSGAEAFLVGGTVDGNAPFNIYPVKDVNGLMKSFRADEPLQDGGQKNF